MLVNLLDLNILADTFDFGTAVYTRSTPDLKAANVLSNGAP
jgi:hypothetical protein